MSLLLSVIRFDDKATRTERRLEDTMAAFREILGKCIVLYQSLYLVGSSASMNNYIQSEEEVDSGNICRKNQVRTVSTFG